MVMENFSVPLIITFCVISVIYLFVCALIGYKRRTIRSTVSVASSIVAMLIAWILTLVIVGKIYNADLSEALAETELIDGIDLSSLLEAGSSSMMLICLIAALAVAPVLYVIVFFVLKLILLIPAGIARSALKKNESDEYKAKKKHNWFGALIGVAAGLIILLPCVFMISSYYGVVYDASKALLQGTTLTDTSDNGQASLSDSAEVSTGSADYTAYLAELANGERSGFLSSFYDGISKPLLSKLTEVKYEDEKVNAVDVTETLCKSVNYAMVAIGDMPSDGELTAETIGKIFDGLIDAVVEMSKNPLLGDTVPDVLELLMDSDVFDGQSGFSKDALAPIIEGLRKDSSSVEKLLNTTKSTMILALELTSGEVDEAVIAENLGQMMENMDKNTAETLKKTVEGLDVFDSLNDETAKVVNEAVGNLCDRLAETENMTTEEKQQNAKALVKLYDISEKLSSSDTSGDVMGTVLPSADEIINDICDSTVISGVIKDMVYDENGNAVENPLGVEVNLTENDKQQVNDAIDAYSKANPDCDKEVTEAMRILLGAN